MLDAVSLDSFLGVRRVLRRLERETYYELLPRPEEWSELTDS